MAAGSRPVPPPAAMTPGMPSRGQPPCHPGRETNPRPPPAPRRRQVGPPCRARTAYRSSRSTASSQAMQVARAGRRQGDGRGERGRALREALRGGPPVVVASTQTSRRMVVRSRSGSNEPPDEITPRVVSQLVGLEGTWQRRRAPADQVYEALRDVAMPEGRPAELFVYPQSLENGSLSHPRSLGAMLADWAVRAGQADDLRRKVEARKGQPMAEFPATVLAAQLALAAGEADRANAALKAIAERLQRDTLRPTTELACHVALPALDRPNTQAVALTVLDACVKSHEGTGPSEVAQVDDADHASPLASCEESGDVAGGAQAAGGVSRDERARTPRGTTAIIRSTCAAGPMPDDRHRVRPRRPLARLPQGTRRLPRCTSGPSVRRY